MKIIGLLMVFVGCILFGSMINEKYKMRIKELQAFIRGFECLQREINYRLTPFAEGCDEASKHIGYGVDDLFRQFAKALEQGDSLEPQKLWQDLLSSQKSRYHLQTEDYHILESFGNRIGVLDKEMQEKDLDYLIKRLSDTVSLLEQEQGKSTKMSLELSILVGACLCILLI